MYELCSMEEVQTGVFVVGKDYPVGLQYQSCLELEESDEGKRKRAVLC
jgi:hypothetical protein